MIRIGHRQLDADSTPFIIAEIGVNHDGCPDRAETLVRLAADTGADAVKFQYFKATSLLSRAARLAAYQQAVGETDPVDMLSRLELTEADCARLVELAHSIGLAAVVTVFSLEHVEIMSQIEWDAFKSASPDLVNLPLLAAMHATGRPLITSCGAATETEIRSAIQAGYGSAYLHCVSAYPTPDAEAQLAGVQAIRQLVDDLDDDRHTPLPLVGYSDHTTRTETGALAVACGAVILEKHFSDDSSRPGPDHRASLTPDAFAEYVEMAHRAHCMMGRQKELVQECELDVRLVSRQSVVSTRAIRAGESISRSDLTIKRPGTGLAPIFMERLVGRRAARDIDADMPLQPEDLHESADLETTTLEPAIHPTA